MTTALLERPTTATGELNHSCTSQCSNPCPYAGSEVDPELAPGMLTADR
jgi:hypothetical protein